MPPELQTATLAQLALGVLLGSFFAAALLALPLKLAAESVYRAPVRLVDALKALFAAYALLTALILGLVRLKVVDLAQAGSISLQIVGLTVGLVILAFTIAIFVRRPDGTRPDFDQSGVVAAIMQVVSLVIALALSTLDLPLNGRP